MTGALVRPRCQKASACFAATCIQYDLREGSKSTLMHDCVYIRLVVVERKKSAAPAQACVFVGAFQLRDPEQLLQLSRCIEKTSAQDAFPSPWQCQAGSAKPHEKERRKIVDTILGKGFTHTLGTCLRLQLPPGIIFNHSHGFQLCDRRTQPPKHLATNGESEGSG